MRRRGVAILLGTYTHSHRTARNRSVTYLFHARPAVGAEFARLTGKRIFFGHDAKLPKMHDVTRGHPESRMPSAVVPLFFPDRPPIIQAAKACIASNSSVIFFFSLSISSLLEIEKFFRVIDLPKQTISRGAVTWVNGGGLF